MEALSDFSELLGLLNEKRVEYVIVGGYAVAFHGAPRFTGDMDIYINPESKNADRVIQVLNEFGFGDLKLTARDFIEPGQVIQLGVPPVRIDLMTSITGVSWQEALAGSEAGTYGPISVRYLGRDHLIKNKRAVGRKQDVADVEALGEADRD